MIGLLTVAEAAVYLGMTKDGLRKAIKRGAVRVAQRTPYGALLRLSDLDAFKAAPRNPGGWPRGKARGKKRCA